MESKNFFFAFILNKFTWIYLGKNLEPFLLNQKETIYEPIYEIIRVLISCHL